jgi:hypothetical protein
MKPRVFFLLILAFSGGLFWLNRAERLVRAETAALEVAMEEVRQCAGDEAEIAGLRSQPTETLTASDLSELVRLRGEIRRLRAEGGRAERLRAQSQRFALELQSGNFIPRRLADEPGAIPRDRWGPAGFATPEAAVQSYVAAYASGSITQAIACLDEEWIARMKPPSSQRNPLGWEVPFWLTRGDAELRSASAYRIVETKARDGGRIVATVEFSIDGWPFYVHLRQISNEWKVTSTVDSFQH